MVESEEITRGTTLLLRPTAHPSQDGGDRHGVLPMIVGTDKRPAQRKVDLLEGDIVVVETPPRRVGDDVLCRVRRALSQSIGEVSWDAMRTCAFVIHR